MLKLKPLEGMDQTSGGENSPHPPFNLHPGLHLTQAVFVKLIASRCLTVDSSHARIKRAFHQPSPDHIYLADSLQA